MPAQWALSCISMDLELDLALGGLGIVLSLKAGMLSCFVEMLEGERVRRSIY